MLHASNYRYDCLNHLCGRNRGFHVATRSQRRTHVISALGVEKEAKKKDDAAATASETKKKKKDPPDLSGVGLEHDAKWISAYLNKEETNKDGEKHEKRFKGTEAERRSVAMWLASLKTEVKKAPAEEKKGEGGTQGEAQSDTSGGK